MVSHTRNLARQVWINIAVPDPKPSSSGTTTPVIDHATLREDKIRTLHLIAAFLVAVKHHLRAEPGIHHSDYVGLLPGYFVRFDEETSNVHEHSGEYASPISGASTPNGPIAPRLRGVGTTENVATQRTPLLKDQHHVVHFHAVSRFGVFVII